MSENGAAEIHHPVSQEIDLNVVDQIVKENQWRRGAALTILEHIQHHFGWVSAAAIDRVAELTDLSPNYLYGVVTYYDEFRIAPPGAITVSICNGSACAVNREDGVLEALERALGIEEVADSSPHELFTQAKWGYVTDDGKVFLRKADCIGCCQLAPVVRVGEDYMVGHLTPETTGPRVLQALEELGVGRPKSERGLRAAGNEFRSGNLK